MKISGNLKVLTEKVKEAGESYSISISGEETRGDERIFSMTLNLSNISRSELKKIAKKLRLDDIKEATRKSFPVSVDLTVPQTRLDNV